MQETQTLNLSAAPTELVVQQQAPKHLGRTRLVAGLKLFSFNTQTGEVKPAVFADSEYRLDGTATHKVKHEADCVYIQTLNQKNAVRKFNKQFKR